MMLYPYENFLVSLFVWLFAFLAVTALVIFLHFFRKKHPDDELFTVRNNKKPVNKTNKTVVKRPDGPDPFREKLGDLVVAYMIEVSRSDSQDLVRHRIKRIREECERLNSMKIPDENKKIISTVLIWAKKFDIDRHIAELKLFRKSTQIVYNHKKRDFKLRVQAD